MGTRINGGLTAGLTALVVTGLLGSWASVATAETTQTTPQTEPVPTVQQQMNDTFFHRDRTFFENHRFPRSVLWITGPFTENEIASDGDDLHSLYEELLSQQIKQTPEIERTPDMPSPYTSSLLTDPIYIEEAVPPAPASSYRPTPEPSRSSSPSYSNPSAPIRALW